MIGRKFDIIEYGLCNVEDMIAEVPESMITVSI